MQPNPFKGLLYSRKFWLAMLASIQSITLHYVEVPPEVWASISAVLVVVIGSIAVEDAAEKGSVSNVAVGEAQSISVGKENASTSETGASDANEEKP